MLLSFAHGRYPTCDRGTSIVPTASPARVERSPITRQAVCRGGDAGRTEPEAGRGLRRVECSATSRRRATCAPMPKRAPRLYLGPVPTEPFITDPTTPAATTEERAALRVL